MRLYELHLLNGILLAKTLFFTVADRKFDFR